MEETYFESALDNVPQLLAHGIAWVFYLKIPPLGNYLLSSEWPLCVSPSRVIPPLFDGFDVVLVDLIFKVY